MGTLKYSKNTLIDNFLKKLAHTFSGWEKNKKLIQKAVEFARKAHDGQVRKYSGEPYIIHPFQVALMLAKKYDDAELVLAAILHDTVEDSDQISMKDIYTLFGHSVGWIVDSVTKSDLFFYKHEKVLRDSVSKLLFGGMKDPRCILLKLADREHNMITLDGLEQKKQIRKSFETQVIYEPLKKLFGKESSMSVLKQKLQTYFLDNHIRNEEDMKDLLLKKTFKEFDTHNFKFIYKNSGNIIWKIENKKLFEQLVKIKKFDEHVEVVSIEEDSTGSFCATFLYKKGMVFKNKGYSVKISSFSI